MRSGSEASPVRSRKQSFNETAGSPSPPSPVGHTAPTTFFLRSERDMQQGSPQPDRETSRQSSSSRSDRLEDSTFGVQSLEDALGETFPNPASPARSANGGVYPDATPSKTETSSIAGDTPLSSTKKRNPIHPKIAAAAQRIISSDHSSSRTSSASSNHPRHLSVSPSRGHLRSTSNTSRDHSFASLRLSPKPGSALSGTPRSGSVRSLALSDEEGSIFDDCGSQAIHSSDEEEDPVAAAPSHEADDVQAGADQFPTVPQLVMPSLSMPKRRPFTDRGNRMGRLKVMVVGPSGVGKTCLIRSILQSCDDIVHVDVNGSNSSLTSQLWHSGASSGRNLTQTKEIAETNASTKAYPSWWSEMDEGRGLKRRRSMGGSILDRNICFVDTPGWDNSGTNEHEHMQEVADEVVTYLEETLGRNASLDHLGDSELLNNLSGGGGLQVDAILYLFHPARIDLPPTELDLLRRLSSLTNLIPVIGKADTCSEDHIRDAKAALRATFDSASVRIFAFNQDNMQALTAGGTMHRIPHAVSSALGDDSDVMDASLLMSPEYMQPLMPSELPDLTRQLFEPDNIQWLRHCAVKKFLRWRREHVGTSIQSHKNELHALLLSSHSRTASDASLISHQSGALIHHAFPETTEARPRIRIAGWAEDLQRALDTERRRFTGHKTAGQVTVHRSQGGRASSKTKERSKDQKLLEEALGGVRGNSSVASVQDPLGVLALGEELSRQGWLVLRVLGGCGVFATGAVWIMRNWDAVTESLGFKSEAQIPGYALVGSGRDDWKDFFRGGRW